MKTILLLATIATSNVFAQNYIINPSNTMNEIIETNTYYSSTIYLDHDGTDSNTIALEWQLIDIQANQDWDYSYCDYTNCYAGNITSGTMTPFGIGQSGFLKVNLMAPSVGSGYFVFTVNKVGDSQNADTLTFNFNIILGITDLNNDSSVSVFPNPSSNGDLTINNIPENSRILLVNSLGKEVYSCTPSSSQLSISNQLNEGVYFLRVITDGELRSVTRIVLK